MSFTKETARGMHDILPREMAIRERLLNIMHDVYGSFGFLHIETPCVERIENLTGGQGGENEKLTFKILKRGDKLKKSISAVAASSAQTGADDALNVDETANTLADSGLRYDLTMPLARFYAAHSSELPSPFKAMQQGPVWRADRPAKGRYRQFMQCDIDILGDASINAEIELIYATSLFLLKAGIGGRTVLINDRRVLRALIDACGFEEPAFADVLISLDKYDKIGMDGVCAELKSAGYAADAIDKYKDLFGGFVEADDKIAYCEGALGDYLDTSILADIRCVIDSIRELSYGENTPRFDISLVRGMGYYTGMVFEVVSTDFGGSSIAGGGRYDAMVGNFTGNGTPACGFSIGFERIVDALLEKLENESSADQGIDEAIAATGVAVLYDKSFSAEDVTQVQKICMIARKGGENIAVMKAAKNAGHQKAQLEADGFGLFLQLKSTDDILGLADRLVSQ